MYVVTGVTGQVGRAVVQQLLAAGKDVRVVVRQEDKADEWKKQGCEVAVADYGNAAALSRAFARSEGIFLLMPPNYDPEPGFPQTTAANTLLKEALLEAAPQKLVMLSTVGAHVARDNLLNNLKMSEDAFRDLPFPVTFLRAAWFMENSSWDLADASLGQINGFLQPPDHPIPMVAVRDIGKAAAALLEQRWQGLRVVELEAARRYSATEIGEALSAAFGHPVQTRYVPRAEWEALFRSQGARNPLPRIQMIDGFNEGWIDFEGAPAEQWTGETRLDQAINDLVRSKGYTQAR